MYNYDNFLEGFLMKIKAATRVIASLVTIPLLVADVSANVSATSGYAYSMGGLSTSVQQIIDTANNWALCGYNSYYNTDITYYYLSLSSVLNSDILYFSGPAEQNSVKLENGLYITSGYNNGTSEVGLCTYTLSYNKLAVFNAGYTASGTSNICTVAKL